MNKVPICMTLTNELIIILKEQAGANGLSVSAYVEMMLRKAVSMNG